MLDIFNYMEKHLILDFDGVLTTRNSSWYCRMNHEPANLFGLDWFDPDCIEALRMIVERTEVKIVVSSSWRDLRMDKLRKVWEFIPLPGELVGTTSVWLPKKTAIQRWIKQHPEDRYIILDDKDLELPNQIKTDPLIGLVKKDAEKAILIFNKES